LRGGAIFGEDKEKKIGNSERKGMGMKGREGRKHHGNKFMVMALI